MTTVETMLNDPDTAGVWNLDPDRSTVGFKVKNMWGLISVKGRFTDVDGDGQITGKGAVFGRLDIQVASIHTGIGKRDKHLRSGDFFDVEHYPGDQCRGDRGRAHRRQCRRFTGDVHHQRGHRCGAASGARRRARRRLGADIGKSRGRPRPVRLGLESAGHDREDGDSDGRRILRPGAAVTVTGQYSLPRACHQPIADPRVQRQPRDPTERHAGVG